MGKFAKFAATSGQPTSAEKERTVPAEATQSPPEDKPKATDLDPRPDLAEDHLRWVAVLSMAWHRDRDLWGLLHGLRCGGARLETRHVNDGREMFRLDYRPLLDVWSEKELRSQWLEPYREAIKRLFADAPGVMQADAELVRRAG